MTPTDADAQDQDVDVAIRRNLQKWGLEEEAVSLRAVAAAAREASRSWWAASQRSHNPLLDDDTRKNARIEVYTAAETLRAAIVAHDKRVSEIIDIVVSFIADIETPRGEGKVGPSS